MRTTRVFLVLMLLTTVATDQGRAQAPGDARVYPNRPITFIVPFLAGSGLDVVGRIVAQKLNMAIGQSVIVDNRPGTGGNLGADFVAKSTPDGYTLLHTINSLAASPALYRNLPFDPVRDLAPIVRITTQPFLLIIHPSLPAKTLREFIELAKARPGQLSYGSSGVGSLDHLAGELFASMAQIKMLHVPYKGGPAVQNDIIGGQITMAFTGMATGVPLLKAGKLRALAVTTANRAKLLPDMPTMAEAGLPGYEVVNSNALYAAAKTPGFIIARLNEEVVKILRLPDVQERFDNLGVEPVGGSADALAAQLKADVVQWKKVVAEAGITPED